MNKKIVFIFLVLLCSLNVGIFSQRNMCKPYSDVGGDSPLDIFVQTVREGREYKVTIMSSTNSRIRIIGFEIKDVPEHELEIENSPLGKTIKGFGSLKTTIRIRDNYYRRITEDMILIKWKSC